MIPLPPPVAGIPFDLETAAGRVAAYELGEGRTVLLLHSFNAAGSGIELAPLATRLAKHRRVVLIDWLGFGTSDRPDAPYGWALYGDQLESIRLAALQPGETSVDVVALSLPGQYVVVAAAEHPRAVRPDRPDQSDRLRPLQRGCRANVPEHLPVPAPDGDRPAVVRGPRSAPGDPLVPPADLRGSGAGPARLRALLLADLSAAGRLAGSAGVRLRVAQRSPGGGRLPAARESDAPRLRGSSALHRPRGRGSARRRERQPGTDHDRARRGSPQLERPDETAAVVDRFLA